MEIQAAIKELISMMNDSNKPNEVRAAAAEGLGYVGGSEARSTLAKMMTDSNKPNVVRAAAAKALGRATQR
ncbi:HEAT repeat domain-containing protein [Pseudomonas sp. LF052]